MNRPIDFLPVRACHACFVFSIHRNARTYTSDVQECYLSYTLDELLAGPYSRCQLSRH